MGEQQLDQGERQFKDTYPHLAGNPAEVLAARLLRAHCSQAQWDDFIGRSSHTMRVVGSGGTMALFGVAYNRIAGKDVCVVMAQPGLPICDQLLAKKLFFETDEKEFLTHCHGWPTYKAWHVPRFRSIDYDDRQLMHTQFAAFQLIFTDIQEQLRDTYEHGPIP